MRAFGRDLGGSECLPVHVAEFVDERSAITKTLAHLWRSPDRIHRSQLNRHIGAVAWEILSLHNHTAEP
jgi:hypothetical protein